jgi:glycosyltransferase involved in cell wall biosynthesis
MTRHTDCYSDTNAEASGDAAINTHSASGIVVVIPVYNDPEGIRTTLDSVLSQSTEQDYRVVVVDNNSTDRTPEIVRSYDDRISLYHENDIQSSYAARNTGIRNTDADLLAFIDADMTVPNGWLDTALEEFETAHADYMGCNVELGLPDDPSLAARYDHHTGFPVEGYLESQHFVPTCCLFVRRAVFADVGLFDHRLESGGDKEFGNRVNNAGYDQHFAENVTLYHPTRDSIADLAAKDRRVGRGLCQLQRFHPDRYGRPGVPPRPSGIKRPSQDLPTSDRVAFGALSSFLTSMRGVGYYHEYVAGSSGRKSTDIPELCGADN